MRALIAVLALGLGFLPATSADAATSDCPVDIGQRARGAAAVEALGDELPEAAEASSMSAKRLERTLRSDHSLWVDECGQAFYTEPQAPAQDSEPQPAATDPWTLHSRPGAERTLYLDFTGEVISGRAWNAGYSANQAFTAEPYSNDSDPAFSQSEFDAIASIWARVAEDYAPFNIDVTTQEPAAEAITRSGAADTRYGTRVLISPTSTIYSSCSCGGIAYVGVYDITSNHTYYQPAFVFTRGVGTGPKAIAEAASHEAGHNLGLSHDGTTSVGYYRGQGAWAPIMGVGYYKPLTQWSKGEYTGANNMQDDLAVMSAHGAPPMPDTVGNTLGTARPIEPGTTQGTIETAGDVDAYTFTATGPTSITATPGPTSPDLDLAVSLYDADAALIATSDPAVSQLSADLASGLDASISQILPPGQYTVTVDGTGFGSASATGYSDYGSLGAYELTLSAATPLLIGRPAPPTGQIAQPYSYLLTGSGGVTPYAWSITSGSLPPGLTLAGNGEVSGAPTATGTFTVQVQLRDATAATTTNQLRIDVLPQTDPAPGSDIPTTPAPTRPGQTAPLPPRITTVRLPIARQGVQYRSRLIASPDGRWRRVSGSLPDGMRLTSSGVLRGTPKAKGRFPFVASVQSGSAQAQRTLVLRVRRHHSLP